MFGWSTQFPFRIPLEVHFPLSLRRQSYHRNHHRHGLKESQSESEMAAASWWASDCCSHTAGDAYVTDKEYTHPYLMTHLLLS